MLIYIIILLITLLISYYLFLKYAESKINNLENKIKNNFLERSSLIPSVFEVSKKHLSRHEDIFHEILNLRKREFSEANNNLELYEILNTKKLIHHEINFIFKICNKHKKLIKEAKFIYLRNLIIKKSADIGENLENYKIAIEKFNKLIDYKNYTILGFILPINKKISL